MELNPAKVNPMDRQHIITNNSILGNIESKQ